MPRPVPIHPVLHSILSEWKLSGWARTFGRHPSPDDLVCPVPPMQPHARTQAVARFRAKLTAARDAAGLSNRQVDATLGTHNMAAHWFDAAQACLPSLAVWPRLQQLLGLGTDKLVTDPKGTVLPGGGLSQLAVLVIPGKNPSGNSGAVVVGGFSGDPAGAPGAYGAYVAAAATLSRTLQIGPEALHEENGAS